MDKKNTMLLTVIAVATLLVAVVGATFAYFSVTSVDETSASAGVTTKTDSVGTVSLTDAGTNFYLYVTAAQMANGAQNVYYGNTTSATTPVVTEKPAATTIATAKVIGGDTGVKYHCTFDYSIATTGGDEAAIAELVKAGKIYVSATNNEGNTVTSNLIGTHALGTDTTGTGTIDLVGATGTVDVQAYVSFENLNAAQNKLAGVTFNTTVDVNNLSCDTAE